VIETLVVGPLAAERPPHPLLANPVVFVVFLVFLWVLISLFLAGTGGWRALARRYGDRGPFEGERRRLQSVRLRAGVNYGNCVTVGRGPRGLRLSMLAPFSIGHTPLVIPWADVPAPLEGRRWLLREAEFRFASAPEVPFRVRPALARWIREGAGKYGAAAVPGGSRSAAASRASSRAAT